MSIPEGDVEDDRTVRIGPEYQAEVPSLITDESFRFYREDECCHSIWSPYAHSLPDDQLNAYLIHAYQISGLNDELALAVLKFLEYNLSFAFEEVVKYKPRDFSWTENDRISFEGAFRIHGKHFAKIRHVIPHKTYPEIVQFYYSWKKPCLKMTLLQQHLSDISEGKVIHDIPSSEESDVDSEHTISSGLDKNHQLVNAELTKIFKDLPSSLKPTLHELSEVGRTCGELNSGFIPEVHHSLKINLTDSAKELQYLKASNFETLQGLPTNLRIPSDAGFRISEWSKLDESMCLFAFRTYGTEDLQLISSFLGNKTVSQVQDFLVKCKSLYKLEDLCCPSLLNKYANGEKINYPFQNLMNPKPQSHAQNSFDSLQIQLSMNQQNTCIDHAKLEKRRQSDAISINNSAVFTDNPINLHYNGAPVNCKSNGEIHHQVEDESEDDDIIVLSGPPKKFRVS